jgi:hypothetical protein
MIVDKPHRRDFGVTQTSARSSIKSTDGHWPMLEDQLAIRRLGGRGDLLLHVTNGIRSADCLH